MPEIGRGRIGVGTGSVSFGSLTGGTAAASSQIARPTVANVTGRNIGPGLGLFAGSNGVDNVVLEFRSLLAGPGIRLENLSSGTIRIVNTGSGGGTGGLGDTGVVPGTYASPTLVIGRDGRIISAIASTSGSLGAVSLGTGAAIYSGRSGNTLQFRSLRADPASGITITPSANDITLSTSGLVRSVGMLGINGINVSGVTGGTITGSGNFVVSLSNTGVIAGTYTLATVGVDAQGRITSIANGTAGVGGSSSISVGGSIVTRIDFAGASVSYSGNFATVTIPTPTLSGLSNATGTSARVFRDVTGGVGIFRRITAGTGITITEGANDIVIEQNGSSGGIDVLKDGAGIGTGFNRFDFIGSGVSLTDGGAGTLLIDVPGAPITALQNLGVTGGNSGQVYDTVASGVAQFRRIVGGSNVTITQSSTDIVINSTPTSSGVEVRDEGTVVGTFTSLNFVGAPITVTGSGSTAIITASLSASGVQNVVNSAVGGGQVLREVNSGTATLRRIIGGGGIAVSTSGDDIIVDGSSVSGSSVIEIGQDAVLIGTFNRINFTGSAAISSAGGTATVDVPSPDGSNLATGGGEVFSDVVGTTLRFRNITGTDGITVSQNTNSIIVSGAALSSPTIPVTNVVNNAGSGVQLLTTALSPSQTVATLRRITGSNGVDVQVNAAGNISIDVSEARVAMPLYNLSGDTGLIFNALRFDGFSTGIVNDGGRQVLRVFFAAGEEPGTVTSVAATGRNGISVTGGPITRDGIFTIALTETLASGGRFTMPIVTVDQFGRITDIEAGPSVIRNVVEPSGDPLTTGDLIQSVTQGTVTLRRLYAAPGELLITTDGSGITFGLPSMVSPGTYSNVEVDLFGRVVGGVPAVGGTGTVSKVEIVSPQDLTVLGSPITTEGTYSIFLTPTGVSAGTYTKLTVDTKGRVTAATNLTPADIENFLGYRPADADGDVLRGVYSIQPPTAGGTASLTVGGSLTATSLNTTANGSFGGSVTINGALTAGTITGLVTSLGSLRGFTLTGSVLGSAQSDLATGVTITTSLNATGITAGTYTAPIIGVDPDGRISMIASGTGGSGGFVASVGLVETGTFGDFVITGSPVTFSSNLNLALSATGVVAGTWNRVVVDSRGRVREGLSGSGVTATEIMTEIGPLDSITFTGTTAFGIAAPLTVGNTLAVTGPASVTGSLSVTGALRGTTASFTGPVTIGTGTLTAVFTNTGGAVFDSQISAPTFVGVATQALALDSARIIGLAGDMTGSVVTDLSTGFTLTGVLPSIVTAGTYENPTLVIDSKGRVIDAISNPGGDGSGIASLTAIGGTGITISGSPIITTEGTLTVALNDVPGLVAGSYNNATVIVDQKGRVVFAASGPEVGTGTVQRVDVNGTNGVFVLGAPVTEIGTFTVGLTASGVTAGTYSFSSIVVDDRGRITSAASGTVPAAAPVILAGDVISAGTTSGTISVALATIGSAGTFNTVVTDTKGRIVSGSLAPYLTQNQTITVTGDATGSGATTVALTLAASGVTAGTYTNAIVAVDEKGRVTFAANGSMGAGTVTSVGITSTDLSVGGSPITTSGNISLDLATTGVVAGTYSFATVTVDAKGRVTLASSGAAVTSVALAAGAGVTIAGSPITTTGTLTVGLEPSGVAAGSYAFSSVTVDQFGRVTSVATGSPVTSVALSGSEFTFTGSPITSAGTIGLALATTGVAAGTYTSVVVDTKGRVTAGTNPSFLTAESDTLDSVAARGATTTATLTVGAIIGNASTASALQTSRDIAISGDATGTVSFDGTSNATIPITLANSGVSPGTYSFATVAVDAKGRVTFAAAGSPGGGPALTTGTYDVARVTVNGSGQISAVEATTVTNRGSAASIMVQSAGTLAFKTIRAGSNVTVTENANEVTISSSATAGPLEVFTFRVNLDGSGAVSSISDVSAGLTVTVGTNTDEVNVVYSAAKPDRFPMIFAFARNTTAPTRFMHRLPVNGRAVAFNAQVYEDFTGFYLDGVSATNLNATAGQYIVFRFLV